jgi:hypothetical protein
VVNFWCLKVEDRADGVRARHGLQELSLLRRLTSHLDLNTKYNKPELWDILHMSPSKWKACFTREEHYNQV